MSIVVKSAIEAIQTIAYNDICTIVDGYINAIGAEFKKKYPKRKLKIIGGMGSVAYFVDDELVSFFYERSGKENFSYKQVRGKKVNKLFQMLFDLDNLLIEVSSGNALDLYVTKDYTF